jgi:hypothetical protein
MRKPRPSAGGQPDAGPEKTSEEYFDIPAFLRRQAD